MASKTKQQQAWARLNSRIDTIEHQASLAKGQLVRLGVCTADKLADKQAGEVIKLMLEKIQRLKAKEEPLTSLLLKQDRVMAAIPACPAHGYTCVENAIEWVNEAKSEKKPSTSRTLHVLETAVTQGSSTDEPEGAKFIQLRYTLAVDLIADLRG